MRGGYRVSGRHVDGGEEVESSLVVEEWSLRCLGIEYEI